MVIGLSTSVFAYTVNVTQEQLDDYSFTNIEMSGNKISLNTGNPLMEWIKKNILGDKSHLKNTIVELNAQKIEAEGTPSAYLLILKFIGNKNKLPDVSQPYQVYFKIDYDTYDATSPSNKVLKDKLADGKFEIDVILDISEENLKKIAFAKSLEIDLIDKIKTKKRTFTAHFKQENFERFKDFFNKYIEKLPQQ